MNYVHICRLRECIARAVLSVSRSYSSRDSERRVQIPLNDDDEEGKEKREESKTSASLNALKKGAHINVPSVSAARTNKSSFVVFEGEKGSALMVRRWFKMLERVELL